MIRWISASEALPNKNGVYLVSASCYVHNTIEEVRFATDLSKIDGSFEKRPGWYDRDKDGKLHERKDITHWAEKGDR